MALCWDVGGRKYVSGAVKERTRDPNKQPDSDVAYCDLLYLLARPARLLHP
jgi:hypothetical protein